MKIRELKQKAQVKVYSHGAFGEDETYYRLDEDQFAELIIQECVEVLRLEMERLDKLNRSFSAQTLETAQLIIKNHFGLY